MKKRIAKVAPCVGQRVSVNMRRVIADTNNHWMLDKIRSGTLSERMNGVIKRIADNGKIGVEFSTRIMRTEDCVSQARDLHGKGTSGYCLYVQLEYIIVPTLWDKLPEPREEIRPQGDIAQSMEDTMLDEEYGMGDEFEFLVGF